MLGQLEIGNALIRCPRCATNGHRVIIIMSRSFLNAAFSLCIAFSQKSHDKFEIVGLMCNEEGREYIHGQRNVESILRGSLFTIAITRRWILRLKLLLDYV